MSWASLAPEPECSSPALSSPSVWPLLPHLPRPTAATQSYGTLQFRPQRPLSRSPAARSCFTTSSAEGQGRGRAGCAHRCIASARQQALVEGRDENPTSVLDRTALPAAGCPARPSPSPSDRPRRPRPAPTPDPGQAPGPGRAPGSRRRPGQARRRVEGGGGRKLGPPFCGQQRRTKPKGRGQLDRSGSRRPSAPAGQLTIPGLRAPCHLFPADPSERAPLPGRSRRAR